MRLMEAADFIEAAMIHNVGLIASGARVTQHVIPYMEGAPGLGKTAAVYMVANRGPLLAAINKTLKTKHKEVQVEVLALAQFDPSELGGWKIPDASGEHMKTTRPQWMPDGTLPSIVFIDELPQGMVACQNVARQIVNERRVGPHHLPDNCLVVAAGNPATSKAGTNHIPTHMRDCLCWLPIEPHLDDTLKYFSEQQVEGVIPAYLRFRPEKLSEFDRDAKACPSPRSWERVNEVLKYNLPEQIRNTGIAGTVGDQTAADFIGYMRVYMNVPDMDKLIKDPMNAPVPTDPGILYAVSSHLAQRMDDKNSENILKYLSRLTRAEFAGFTIVDAIHRDKALRRDKFVREWLLAHQEIILS